MADEQEQPQAKRAKGPLATLARTVGAFTIGAFFDDAKRRSDVIKLGAATAILYLAVAILGSWERDRVADRSMRQAQHDDLKAVMERQHSEDREDRRQDRCVSAQLTDTVRAAIWHEKPRSMKDCP